MISDLRIISEFDSHWESYSSGFILSKLSKLPNTNEDQSIKGFLKS